ncbi:FAD:protein FMN transferase [Clostridium perfringens]|uniref:FAD:protein FMN transferase n=1 Tax=Clostridium perfringens TaxID=1502 RepID=A0A4Y5T4S6_CLOPF|nr:FAD:protein FMN transferase [Clostridium perfringens]EGT5619909.1 FAD:protein FMN transferase [Clostridium perfringens]EHK2441341.1 FAD:protein FMN transferase [Clostridium perfringens]MDK0538079.1 FAD:protein FMN transferase [Clostridium perfringens]MDM0463375.1 FAD:protein FMN transferase [Clostridium perfringens]MDT9335174.1 FAD:protein FMN transferase [Clostridium perfringens]
MEKESILNNNFFMQGFYFDTIVEIRISCCLNKGKNILHKSFDLCKYYEELLSKTKKGSDIYNINNNVEKGFNVNNETLSIINRSLYYSELSNGNFDISIQPLLKLWNFKSEKKSIPSQKDIDECLKLVNYKNILIDRNNIKLRKKGMSIDLGGIAKGYIANKIKEYLISEGVNSGIINLGGNVLCIGKKENGESFKVGIQKPFSERGEVLGVLEICDKSVVSSGIYERFFKKDNKVYHHIINPKNGKPFENDLVQVTIISDDSMDGDALSTIALSFGEKEGMNLINSIDGVEGIFINKNGNIRFTKNFEGVF